MERRVDGLSTTKLDMMYVGWVDIHDVWRYGWVGVKRDRIKNIYRGLWVFTCSIGRVQCHYPLISSRINASIMLHRCDYCHAIE
jgi:hypothetical protein